VTVVRDLHAISKPFFQVIDKSDRVIGIPAADRSLDYVPSFYVAPIR
jgi:hypothetical protein